MIEIHLNFSSLSRQPILIATVPQTYWRLFRKDFKGNKKGLQGKCRNFFARKLPLILKKDFQSFFWCAISVSILSCYFDYGRRRDKISPFCTFSNTSLLDMSWFIYSNPSFLRETQQERKAISTIHPLSNMNNRWGFLIHEYILIKISKELRWFISYFSVILILLALQRLKKKRQQLAFTKSL